MLLSVGAVLHLKTPAGPKTSAARTLRWLLGTIGLTRGAGAVHRPRDSEGARRETMAQRPGLTARGRLRSVGAEWSSVRGVKGRRPNHFHTEGLRCTFSPHHSRRTAVSAAPCRASWRRRWRPACLAAASA